MTISWPGSGNTFPDRLLYYSAALLPYLTVPAGLYLLKSAWSAILAYQLGMLLFLLVARRPPRQPEIVRRRAPRRWTAALLAACLSSGLLVLLIWPWAGRLSPADLAVWLSRLGLAPKTWPVFIAYMCLTTPWLEEQYWRGWLGRLGRPAVETSAWFAGYHLLVLMPILQPAWLALVFFSLTAAGWSWQRLSGFRNGLLWAVLSHSAADLSVMLAASWLLRT